MGRLVSIQETIQRMNMLYDFYGELLTQKQADYFTMHYMDDLSMAEIASMYQVTPQAAADIIKRTCVMLEKYDMKLKLLEKHEKQLDIIKAINESLDGLSDDKEKTEPLRLLINKLLD